MKLTFKDLKQQKFSVDAEPSHKISDVKKKIAEEQKWEPSLLKLIYSGKVLQDDNTVESYNIEEKGYIVCMIQKPKTTAASSSKAPPSTPAPVAPQTPAAPSAPAPSAARADPTPATPSPAAPAVAAATPGGTAFNDPSALTLGAAQEEAISNMEAMGFERSQINRAMRAAFFNPDRAVEYLLTGIPENALREQAQAQQDPRSPGATPAAQPPQAATQPRATAAAPAAAPATAPAATGTATSTGGEEPQDLFQLAAQAGQGGRGATSGAGGAAAPSGGAGAAEPGSLDFLRNNPQFQQLRQLVQQQPQMLEPILQQVGAGNPQLAQLISSHQNEFIQLLYEDGDEDTPLPPGAQAISVTEEEREAIERLCRLGFERDLVIQAYFACDKNEEFAANFLFDQPDDDEPPAQ